MLTLLSMTFRCYIRSSGYHLIQKPSVSTKLNKCYLHQSKMLTKLSSTIKGIEFDKHRLLLYDHSKDVILKELNCAQSVDDIYLIISKHKISLTYQHVCQAIISLWDFQKEFYEDLNSKMSQSDQERRQADSKFNELHQLVEEKSSQMDNESLTCVLTFLIKLGIEESSNVVTALILECQKRCFDFNMASLANFSDSLKLLDRSDSFIAGQVIHALDNKFGNINEMKNLISASVIINNLKAVCSTRIIQKLLDKIAPLYLSNDNIPTVDASLKFVIPVILLKDYNLLKIILQNLAVSIHELSVKDLFNLFFRIKLHGIVDQGFLYVLQERSQQLLLQCSNPEECIILSAIVAPNCTFEMKLYIEDIVTNFLSNLKLKTLIRVGYILKDIQSSNAKLIHSYWKKVQTLLRDHLDFIEIFLPIYHRCSSINLRYQAFEDWLVPLLYNHLQDYLVPYSVARVAEFLIAYNRGFISEALINKLKEMAPQFTYHDISFVAEGIKTAWKLNPSRILQKKLLIIHQILNKTLLERLQKIKTLPDLNQVVESLAINETIPDAVLDELMDKYLLFTKEFNPYYIYSISKLIRKLNYWIPPLLDSMMKYALQNKNLLSREIFSLLRACYHVSYLPEQGADFFQACMDVYLQLQSRLYCHELLILANCFSLFEYYPHQLVKQIFCIDFLDKLEKEVEGIAGHNLLSNRRMLMDFNRALCLDCPELDIPWFHEQYCRDFCISAPVNFSTLHEDIYSVLCESFKDKKFIGWNVYTPYYYNIAFEIVLHKSKQPLIWSEYVRGPEIYQRIYSSVFQESDIQRIAINVTLERAFCSNARQLQGIHQLKRRHLQIMGYKIIEIPYFEWNSLPLTYKAKQEYLLKQIFD